MDIAASGQDILNGKGVIAQLFYDKYLQRYPDVGRFFETTDMNQQAVMLRMALTIVEQYFRFRYRAMEDYLRILGFRHMRQGIPRELFADWRDCMLDTLEDFHAEDWGDSLESQWTAAINLALERIHEGYDLEEGHV